MIRQEILDMAYKVQVQPYAYLGSGKGRDRRSYAITQGDYDHQRRRGWSWYGPNGKEADFLTDVSEIAQAAWDVAYLEVMVEANNWEEVHLVPLIERVRNIMRGG